MIDLGRHAIFIWSSYGVVVVVLVMLIMWLMLEGRSLKRQLADFEARGITRRSRRPKGSTLTGASDATSNIAKDRAAS